MGSGGIVGNKVGIKMNEIHYTQFQIRPRDGEQFDWDRPCMFKGECFDLNHIVHISPVGSYDGINHYTFEVTLQCDRFSKVLEFNSPTKVEALRWQRELSRAWTKTGEFTPKKDGAANGEPTKEGE